MDFIRRFLRLRKQDDRVKIMVVLVIIVVIVAVSITKNTINMYNYINSPVEYELNGNLSSNLRINDLSQLKYVKAISLQGNFSAAVRYKMNEAVISYVVLSSEYASCIYGVNNTGNMTTFYANQQAYDRLLKDFKLDKYYDAYVYDSGEILLEYRADDEKYNSAKLVLLDALSYEEPYIFTIENNAALRNEAGKLRVCVSKQDMEQMIIREFENRGYSLCDKEKVLEFQNKLEVMLLKIKYQVIICLMSILWILTIHRYRRRPNDIDLFI